MEDGVIEQLKFCPNCGHEGHDDECPVCQVKMESLNAEVEKLAEAEVFLAEYHIATGTDHDLRNRLNKLLSARGESIEKNRREFIKKQGQPLYDEEILKEGKAGAAVDAEKDDMYEEAVRVIMAPATMRNCFTA